MRKTTLTGIFGLAFIGACATTPPPTAQQRMSDIFSTYDESDKQLAQAETDLAAFEKNVMNL